MQVSGLMSGSRITLLTMYYITAFLPGVFLSDNTVPNAVSVRVFEKAPRGTLIYQVSVSSLLDVTKYRLFQLEHTGPDKDKFGLTEDNTLRVEQYPYLNGALDRIYTVYIQARTMDNLDLLISQLQIQIIVSRTNSFPPSFEEAPVFEVFRHIQEGTIIGQVQVVDADQEAYNRKSVFRLSPAHSTPFSISEQTGVLRTMEGLEEAPHTFSLRVTAVNTGSPQLKKASTLTVVVREISEPLSLSIEKHNLTHAEACWQRPSYGDVKRYVLRLEKKQGSGSVTRRLVRPHPGNDRQCLVFTPETQQDYVVTVRAQNGPTLGLPTRVNFRMERSRCGQEVCTGRCVFTPDGATCLCEGGHRNCGYSGRCSNCPVSDQNQCQCIEGDEDCNAECTESCLNNGQLHQENVGKLGCHCTEGYYGNRCEMYNPCTNVVCENSGSCKNVSSKEYICICGSGYYGQHCEDFNPCYKHPCRNSGQCTNSSGSAYQCSCKHGFYGNHCQKYDPCFVRPCLNKGQCKNISDTSYTCSCPPGYYGHSCEVYQPCSSNPCLHGGFCNSVDGHYECHCPRGRFGRKCEHINLCLQLDPCSDHTVTCHNMTDFGYKCICEPGWHGDNCTDFDPCFDQPCQHGGQCEQKSDMSYTCNCPKTYFGENCERTNLCASNPCLNGASCRNISNHDYQCLCKDGYHGDMCADYDACHSSQCQNGGICQNSSVNGYTCLCPETYVGDFCQHHNSCYESPCKHGLCLVDQDGFYSCLCDPAYNGVNCQSYDPCRSGPCQNRGACVQTREGNYGCLCKAHYYGNHCEHYDTCYSNPCLQGGCMNLPDRAYRCECLAGRYGQQCDSTDPCADQPCKYGASCIHLQHQEYSCKCTKGWHGIHCELRNPCFDNPCHNGGECIHLGNNDFLCSCPENFQGTICEQEVPCIPGRGQICYNGGECMKHPDGTLTCECREGYHGNRCQSYDPCHRSGLCQHGGTCFVAESGGFMCQCLDGFFGDYCEYHTSCRQEGLCSSGATCVQGLEIMCYCREGYTGPRCAEDIDECLSSPCHKDASCQNLPGSFVCTCLYGYTGPECQMSVTCDTEVTHEALGTFTWGQSPHGVTFSIKCSDSQDRYAKRDCLLQKDGTARWSDPDTTECELKIKNPSHALQTLQRYRNVTSFNKSHELTQAKELLNVVLPYSLNYSKVTDEFMTIVDKILSAPADVIRDSQVANSQELRLQPRELCQKCGLLELLDEFMAYVALNDNMTIRKSNFELYTKQNTYIEHELGITFKPQNNPTAQIFLPAEVFQRDQSNERVKFIHFRSAKLFSVQHNKPVAGLVHEVLSASVGRTETMNLQNCIEFILPNMESPRHANCVYWDQKGQFWATDGLRKLTHSGFSTVCCSTHLSYLSVASNPNQAHITMTVEHLYLSLTSYIGTGCGVMALTVVFTTYTVFRQLHRHATNQVLIQFTLTLLLLTVSLLLSRDRQQLSSAALCLTVAILSHFLFLSALLWALILGQAVYVRATQGEQAATTVYVIKMCLLAYGLPLACVLTLSLLQSSLYLSDLDSCHVTAQSTPLYYSLYLAPCGLAILGELIVTFKLMQAKCCAIKSHGSATECTQKAGSSFWQTYGTITTMFFLTLSWVLKLAAAVTKQLDYTVYFGSAHFITNGIVGCCVCFFFFVVSTPARQAWSTCSGRGSPLSSRQRVAGKSSVQSRNLSTEEGRYALVGAKPKENVKEKTRFHRQKTVHRSTTSDFTVPDSPPPSTTAGGGHHCRQMAKNNPPQVAEPMRSSSPHFNVDKMDFNARTSRV